jgi:tRNA nucleotidyltransferase (CCA-adding enzyme)
VRNRWREALRRALPTAIDELLARVVGEAERKGIAVHLVGGPVRDLLLGRPLRDVDLIVEPREGWDAEALARAAAPDGARIVSHSRFGTARLSTAHASLDLAEIRNESYARPGALPRVEPGSLEEDLRRRDFTVNALAIPLSSAAAAGRSEIVDPDGGRADLESQVLRIFHERSFHDDPTRALRAARLAARLGFRLSRASRSALRDALRDGAFGAVSGERLRHEIEKLFEDSLLGQEPQRALRLLAQWHVLGALEPGLGLPRRAVTPVRLLGRVLKEPPWSRGRLRPWACGLAVWLAAVDTTVRRRTLRRLAVRGELAERIAGFPNQRRQWLRVLASARGRGGIDALLREIDEERLHALYAWAPPALRRRIVRWACEDRTRRLPVSGADLLALGLSGPIVGQALARIRSAHLDGLVRDREEALALARELGRASSGGGRGRARRRPRADV